jgi:glutamate-ammonia-ligase adenylyltransferase
VRPAELSNIPFQDRQAAEANFARVRARISPALAAVLPALVANAPDPDSALLLFDRLVSESAEVARVLERHHSLAHYALVVFGHSRFLGETLTHNPDLLQSFLRERNLDRSFSQEEFHEAWARFRSRSFENDISLLLARFRRREYVRIMLRDVLKIAPLAETTAEISALADVLIEEALREARSQLLRHLEPPQHVDAEGRESDTPFAVLSLGKLGGNELNYSSDVDLLYVFGDGQEPPGRKVSNREFFIRLAQQLTETLSRMTREGAVFRIDLRLRPQGGEGELAISLSEALRYYTTSAHDWERQALIKVRHSAGDATLAREFIRGTQSGVYTAEINFAAVKTALVAREKMHKKRRPSAAAEPSAATINIKVDPGGIRDIEFLVQCLQRVYGGAEPWLRSGGTLFSLQKLHDKGHVSGKEFHDLTSAYEFLRHLEHRLQLRQGQQTHQLPLAGEELRILQRAMEGYAPGEDPTLDLVPMVRKRMTAVAEIYQRVIYQQQTHSYQQGPGAEFELWGAPEPAASDYSQQQLLERLASDCPALNPAAIRRELGPHGRKNLYRFLGSAATSSQRYGAVVRHPKGVEAALKLFERSEYLTDILVRHPEEVATLSALGPPPQRWEVFNLFGSELVPARAASDPVFAYLADSSASHADKLALLRRHYRHRVLASGSRDITEGRGVSESFAETTNAAEDAIAAAFAMAGSPEGLAVMALGRLGSGEFDVLSDADVVFVCAEGCDTEALTRAAEQMVQALAAYTRDGMVFPVDPRLRPRGSEGELLVTPRQLETYFKDEAQAWEALMYTKLRFIIGSRNLADECRTAVKTLFARFAAGQSFLEAVREMRTKLDLADAPERTFKTSAGGIYDIDFLCSYLVVKHGVDHKAGSLRDRLWLCVASGLLEKADAAALDHAAELFRTVEHVVRLVVGRARKWLPATEHARQVTEQLTSTILGQEFPHGLEVEIVRSCQQVRGIYERMMVPPSTSS